MTRRIIKFGVGGVVDRRWCRYLGLRVWEDNIRKQMLGGWFV